MPIGQVTWVIDGVPLGLLLGLEEMWCPYVRNRQWLLDPAQNLNTKQLL